MAAAAFGCVALAVAACGGGGHPADDGSLRAAAGIAACLEGFSFPAEVVEETANDELVGAHSPDGDTIVVVNMSTAISSRPEVPYLLTQEVKKKLRQAHRGGLLITSTANDGATYIAVLGVEGIDGGVPATGTEIVARHCAIKATRRARAAGA